MNNTTIRGLHAGLFGAVATLAALAGGTAQALPIAEADAAALCSADLAISGWQRMTMTRGTPVTFGQYRPAGFSVLYGELRGAAVATYDGALSGSAVTVAASVAASQGVASAEASPLGSVFAFVDADDASPVRSLDVDGSATRTDRTSSQPVGDAVVPGGALPVDTGAQRPSGRVAEEPYFEVQVAADVWGSEASPSSDAVPIPGASDTPYGEWASGEGATDVPEPGSVPLVVLGLGLLVLARKTRGA